MHNLNVKAVIVVVAMLAGGLGYIVEKAAPGSERGDVFAPPMAPPPREEKRWIEVNRTKLVSTVMDLNGYHGWMMKATPAVPNAKVILMPQCAVSEPERVVFAILDGENMARMQAGYPPMAIASRPANAAGELEAPRGQAYWMGFIELPAKGPTQPIPGSTLGALIYLADAARRPPVRLSVDIYSSVRVFATPSEARKTIMQLANGQVGR